MVISAFISPGWSTLCPAVSWFLVFVGSSNSRTRGQGMVDAECSSMLMGAITAA